jgi:hypothetical protein
MILCNFAERQLPLPEREGQRPLRIALRKLRKAPASLNARGMPLPAATENGYGTGGPQAWAEFCLAYSKRLPPLLAMAAMKIGCYDQRHRFKAKIRERLDRFSANRLRQKRPKVAFSRHFSLARK